MKGTRPLDERFDCLAKVEPAIDDLHRARVWAGIESRLAARSKFRWSWRVPIAFASGGVAVAVVLMLARPLFRPSPSPSATRAVPAGPPISAPRPLPSDGAAVIAPYLVAGTVPVDYLDGPRRRLEAPAGGLVRAQLGEGARITLVGPAALAVVSSDARSLAISVERGLLLCDYDHRTARTLHVLSPHAETVVTGTLFAVEAAANRTRISVARGSVSVTSQAQTVSVSAGHSFASAASAMQPLDPATASLLAEHDASIRPASGSSGVLSVSANSRAGSAWIGDHLLGVPPVSARLPSGPTRVLFSPGATLEAARRARTQVIDTIVLPGKTAVALTAKQQAPNPTREAPHAGPARQKAPVQPQEPSFPAESTDDPARMPDATDDPRLLYREAERQMRARDLAGARRSLESLVHRFPADKLASTARYELARAAFTRHDWDDARRHLDEMSTRTMAASLSEPAHYLGCRVEVAAKKREAAIVCLMTLLRESPDSAHSAEALALLASYRLEESCAAALPYLDEYLRRFPRGSFAAQAKARRMECAP